jgi:hypothetical protein
MKHTSEKPKSSTTFAEDLIESLGQALAHARGENTDVRVHRRYAAGDSRRIMPKPKGK